MDENKKRIVKKYIFISFLIIALGISLSLMIKYSVEGEKNMSFKLSKIIIQSSLDTQSRDSENLWDLELMENNDVYIYIERNEEIQTEEKIKSVTISRISLTQKNKIGEIAVFLPTSNNLNKMFVQSTENYLNKNIEFYANTSDNLEKQEICENGGMIAFRISNQNIGEYVSNEGDEIKYDKSLLEKAEIKEEDLKFITEIDLIIETTEDSKYKGTITLELPASTFENNGYINKEITDFSNVIFKRTE